MLEGWCTKVQEGGDIGARCLATRDVRDVTYSVNLSVGWAGGGVCCAVVLAVCNNVTR